MKDIIVEEGREQNSNRMWYVGSCYSFMLLFGSHAQLLNIVKSSDLYYTNRFSVRAA